MSAGLLETWVAPAGADVTAAGNRASTACRMFCILRKGLELIPRDLEPADGEWLRQKDIDRTFVVAAALFESRRAHLEAAGGHRDHRRAALAIRKRANRQFPVGDSSLCRSIQAAQADGCAIAALLSIALRCRLLRLATFASGWDAASPGAIIGTVKHDVEDRRDGRKHRSHYGAAVAHGQARLDRVDYYAEHHDQEPEKGIERRHCQSLGRIKTRSLSAYLPDPPQNREAANTAYKD